MASPNPTGGADATLFVLAEHLEFWRYAVESVASDDANQDLGGLTLDELDHQIAVLTRLRQNLVQLQDVDGGVNFGESPEMLRRVVQTLIADGAAQMDETYGIDAARGNYMHEVGLELLGRLPSEVAA